MEIPKNQWTEYLTTAKKVVIKINKGIKELTFLGVPSIQNEGTYLSSNLLKELNALGLNPYAQAYSFGLISLKNESNDRFNLLELDIYLTNRIKEITEDSTSANWLDQLILANKLIQLLLHEHLYLREQAINLEMLIKEQDKIYTQIACYCLPPLFLCQLKNPMSFLDHIGPQLGRYLLLLKDQKC